MSSAEPTLRWPDIAARLHAERTVWLGTVTEDHAPHAAPVWLTVLDGEVFVFTSRSSVKARNLLGNPQAVLHSEDANDVLIVSGSLQHAGHPLELPAVMTAFEEKYREPGDAGFLPGQDPTADTLFRLVPAKAMAWSLAEFEGSQRRWP